MQTGGDAGGKTSSIFADPDGQRLGLRVWTDALHTLTRVYAYIQVAGIAAPVVWLQLIPSAVTPALLWARNRRGQIQGAGA